MSVACKTVTGGTGGCGFYCVPGIMGLVAGIMGLDPSTQQFGAPFSLYV